MSSSPPDGFTSRVVTAADIEAAAAVVRAEEKTVRGRSVWDVADMSDFWRMVNFDDAAWALEQDGRLVAFAAGIERAERADWWISVHPDAAGRGLGTWLLAQAERRSRDAGAARMDAGMFAENAAAKRLLEELGFRDALHYFQMRIELDHEPDVPQPVEGVAIERFRRDDARAFHAAMNEAFAGDPGQISVTFDEWERFRLDASDTDLSLWFVARDGDEIAGFARCDANREGGGWIGILGVRERWRRRGLGLALLQTAFREFHRRGVEHVGLGVDARNPTGATRLYERAGMRVLNEDVVYEKELT